MRTSYAVFNGSVIPRVVAFFLLKESGELLFGRKLNFPGMPRRPSLQAACNKRHIKQQSRTVDAFHACSPSGVCRQDIGKYSPHKAGE